MTATTESSTVSPAPKRAALAGILDNFLSAVIAGQPSQVRVAPKLRYTENAEPIALGEGLWRTALRIRPETRVDFIDPVNGQAGTQLVVEERGGTPAIVQLRLKVEDGAISEIEGIVVHEADLKFFDAKGMIPVPIFKQVVPESKRKGRAVMIDTVERYVELLKNGSYSKSGTRIHPEMVRWENGAVTSDYALLSTRENGPVRAAIPTRIPLIDEEYGLVYALLEFGTAERTLCPFELFKIEGDQIMMLHIVIKVMPTRAWA